MIARRVVTGVLKDFLEENVGVPVGIDVGPSSEVTRDVVDLPYIHMTPRGGLPFSGTFFDLYDDANFGFDITSVGERQDQTEAVADKVREAILGRDSRGFQYDINIPGVFIMMREPLGPPGRLDREGRIYNVVDSYMLRLTVSGEADSGS